MKKSFNRLTLLLAMASVLLTACNKEEDLVPVRPGDLNGLGGDTWTQTSIDKWLYDSLVVPYNIGVKYKWDQFDFDISRTLVPPDESKIVPLWTVMKEAWIRPYVAEAGKVFFNKFSPKTFVLSGSFSYNDDGSRILGTAEGGRKIVLYGVNDFRVKGQPDYVAKDDSGYVKEFFFKTVHHEFGHILHQNIYYSPGFKKINPALISGQNWINISDVEALQDGFVTPYASNNFDDDFVETIAVLLVEGKNGFDYLVNSIPNGTSANGTTRAQAQQYLRQKEAVVVDYFKQSYNINFYALQARCRAALEKYIL
jgi:substrate import-associated zinc metallohydrolase lipoprotein